MDSPEKGIYPTAVKIETAPRVSQGARKVDTSSSPKPEKRPRRPLIRRLVNSLALRLGLAGIAATIASTAGYEVYQKITDGNRRADQPIGIVSPENTPPGRILDNLDHSPNEGSFGNNNMVLKNLQEIQSQFPEQIVAEGNTITFLNPFQLPEDTDASYKKGLSDRLPTDELQQQAEKDKVKDNIEFILPKGTTIVTPADAHMLVAKGRTRANEDPSMSPMIWLYHYDPVLNKTYQFWFFTVDSSGLSPLVDMQDFTPDASRGTKWQELPNVRQGSPLAQTTKDKQKVVLNVKIYQGMKVGPEAEIADKTLSLATSQFFTAANSKNNNQLVGLKK